MVPYPISHYVSCDKFFPSHRTFLAAITGGDEPTSFKEAMKDERWRNAASMEVKALEANRTWDVTDLPPNKKAIGCHWVFTIKYTSNWEFEPYKARLVAYGNIQEAGLDYDETFALFIKMTMVTMFLKVTAVKEWKFTGWTYITHSCMVIFTKKSI
ncbi:uncharacterized protein LOC112086611 [Eutrema salsugineum]|uniref:uncharacterized protein LOC112086611 n=1 Tax=Eutrema salsugineum TaxID=72664 RepID=UPI000CECF347|nr:uncharacterized protein LOC112086611 [Eutrema salsugineum]